MNSHHTTSNGNQHLLPSLLAKPIELIPEKIHSSVIIKVLNKLLEQALKDGELDFLEQQSISVEVSDLKLKFALGLSNEKLVTSRWKKQDKLNLSGNLYDFMLLASRKEDSDTLFFQRRLKMQGDTDLGLYVKNLLDGMDMDSFKYHKQLDSVLHHGINFFERFF